MKFRSIRFRIPVIIGMILSTVLVCINANAQTDAGLAYKKPFFDYMPEKSVFAYTTEQQENKSRMLRNYILSGYKEGVNPVSGIFGVNFQANADTVNGTNKICMLNLSIEDIFTHGLQSKNFVVLDVNDPSRYRYDPSYGSELEWKRKNTYCFELTLPYGIGNTLPVIDTLLQSLFDVQLIREKRSIQTLVLKRSSSIDKIKAIGGGQLRDYQNGHFANVQLRELTSAIGTALPVPVVNATDYPGLININLEITDWSDMASVRKALARYDLNLVEEMIEWDVLVIREKNFKKN